MEAEYVAESVTVKEIMWITQLIKKNVNAEYKHYHKLIIKMQYI